MLDPAYSIGKIGENTLLHFCLSIVFCSSYISYFCSILADWFEGPVSKTVKYRTWEYSAYIWWEI
jgi:hypothetical protein